MFFEYRKMNILKLNINRNRNKCKLILLFIICLTITPILSLGYKTCHYSCKYCSSQSYAHCIQCLDPQTQLSILYNYDAVGKNHNTILQYPWGSCIGKLPQINVFGIILFILVVGVFILLRNRTIFYFLTTIQMFGLLALVEIPMVNPLSYMLQGFQYFMITTAGNKNNTNKFYDINLYMQNRIRMSDLFKQYNFISNVIPVFLLSLVAFVIVFIIPIIRYYFVSNNKKEITKIYQLDNNNKNKQLNNQNSKCIPLSLTLNKCLNILQTSFILCFFFLIQQTILICLIGVSLDPSIQSASNIIILIIYALILSCMIINICSKNMQIFPNKAEQQIQILKKCVLPTFIILPVQNNGIIIIFIIILAGLGLFFNQAKGKQKKKTQFHQQLIKRQKKYRIIQIVTILLFGVYYLIEKFVKSYSVTMAVGVISFLLFLAYTICFFIQVFIQLYGKYKLKQNQSLYNIDTSIMSTVRPQKGLQQTLQNLQHDEQGIMDMIFFGRNNTNNNTNNNNNGISQNSSPLNQDKKNKNNIKLTLQLDQQQSYTNDKEKLTTGKFSQNNRDDEKFFPKNRSARTPKNRASKLKLDINEGKTQNNQNHVLDIVNIQMKKQLNNHIQQTNSQNFTEGNKTSRSQVKTARQIKFVIQNLSDDDDHSPKFNDNYYQMQDQKQKQNNKQQSEEQQQPNNTIQNKQESQQKKQKNKSKIKAKNKNINNNKATNQRIRKAYGL